MLNNSRGRRIKNAKFSVHYFYMNTNIYGHFQICISVPLIRFLSYKKLSAEVCFNQFWILNTPFKGPIFSGFIRQKKEKCYIYDSLQLKLRQINCCNMRFLLITISHTVTKWVHYAMCFFGKTLLARTLIARIKTLFGQCFKIYWETLG